MVNHHEVQHLLSAGDYVRTKYRCTAEIGAECRMGCTRCIRDGEESGCVCEWEDREPQREDQGSCAIVAWLENDAPEECFAGADGTEVRGPGWQPMKVGWNGDNYEWEYADEQP